MNPDSQNTQLPVSARRMQQATDDAVVQRYWDAQYGLYAVKLLPGAYYVTAHNEMITTVVGSCIATCIRDVRLGIGGMNHFLLPVGELGRDQAAPTGLLSTAARYGNHAMELLINGILEQGGSRANLEVKVFGGGRILARMATDIGQCNIAFVRDYIGLEGLKLVAQDVGGPYPRKLLYFPTSGKVWMKKLRALREESIGQQEQLYLQRLTGQPSEDRIELFQPHAR